jgi:hypothetical protein
MKRCPLCNRTYFNDEFAFCLEDGALLSPPYDPAETQIIPAPYNKNLKEPTGRLLLTRFWESFIALAEGKTDLLAKLPPSTRDTLDIRKCRATYLSYVVNQHSSRVALFTYKAELYEELERHKQEIVAAFGEDLIWTPREAGKQSRIAYDMTVGGYKDETDWGKIQTAMIDAMIRFEKALSLFIPQWVHLR